MFNKYIRKYDVERVVNLFLILSGDCRYPWLSFHHWFHFHISKPNTAEKINKSKHSHAHTAYINKMIISSFGRRNIAEIGFFFKIKNNNNNRNEPYYA